MRFASLLVLSLLSAACEHEAAASRETAAAARATTPPREGEPHPVLVELYTSQGCSSCPPADALVRDLVSDPPDGITVVPLAFHVDYWDDLGWPDPFGDPRWTARQSEHAAATRSNRIYTPQLLFDGRDHRTGPRRGRAEAALRTMSTRAASVALTLELTESDREVVVAARPQWREGAARAPVAIMVALTDGGHRTEVHYGENAGRTLAGDFVVRDLVKACVLPPRGPAPPCEAALPLDALDRPDSRRVVAFAQDSERRILGVATAE